MYIKFDKRCLRKKEHFPEKSYSKIPSKATSYITNLKRLRFSEPIIHVVPLSKIAIHKKSLRAAL